MNERGFQRLPRPVPSRFSFGALAGVVCLATLLLFSVPAAADVELASWTVNRGASNLERQIGFKVDVFVNGTAVNGDFIDTIAFAAPSGWSVNLTTSAHIPPSNWKVASVTASEVIFNVTSGNGLNGASEIADFKVNATSSVISSNATAANWIVRGFDTASCTDVAGSCNDQKTVASFVETLSIRDFQIVEPDGSMDREVSMGSTVLFRAFVVNTGGGNIADGRLRISGPSEVTQTNATGVVIAGTPDTAVETQVQLDFTFANLTGSTTNLTRALTAQVITGPGNSSATQLNYSLVVRPPRLNASSQNVSIAAGSPTTITTLATAPSPGLDPTSIPVNVLTSTNVTFVLDNTGFATATGITVEPWVYLNTTTPVNHTQNFTSAFVSATDPVTGAIVTTGIPDLARTQTTRVTMQLTPKTGSNAPPEGRYTVSLGISLWDLNTKRDVPQTKILQNITNTTEIFSIDASRPFIEERSPLPPSNVEFQRGGANVVNFVANISDANLNPESVRLVVLNERVLSNGLAGPCGGSTQNTVYDATTGFRCIIANLSMAKAGNGLDWTASYDFALEAANITGPAGSLYRAVVIARDRSGLEGHQTFTNLVHLRDTRAPVVTGLSAPASSPLGAAVSVSVQARDEHQLTKVRLRVTNVDSGVDVSILGNPGALSNAGAEGVPMSCNNCGSGTNGTYQVTIFPDTSGTYILRVLATDLVGLVGESTSPVNVSLRVSSALSLYLAESGGNVKGKNLTVSAGANHQNDAVFTTVTLLNEASAAEDFNFECRVLPTDTNVTGLQGCNVSFLLPGEAAPPAGGQPLQDRTWPNTVNVTIYTGTGATKVFKDNITGIQDLGAFLTQTLTVEVSAPPSARPGNLVRIELTAKPKFSSERSSVILGYEVAEARGVSVHFADTNPKPVLSPVLQDQPDSIVRIIKPTRATEYSFRVNNTGNIEQLFHVKAVNVPNGWTFDFASSDSRWNDFTESILLAPAGASGALNSTVIRAVVTAPSTATELMPDQNITLRGNTSNAAGAAISRDARLQLTVRAPSITIGTWTAANVAALGGNGTFVNDNEPFVVPPRAGQNCVGHAPPANHSRFGNASLPRTTCTYVSGGWTAFNFTATISSTLNVNPSDARITPTLIVTGPCGLSCPGGTGSPAAAGVFTVPMTASGGQFQGQNGAYFAAINLTDAVGNFSVRVRASDATDPSGTTGDAFESVNVTLSIPERHTLTGTGELVAPTQCCVQVREGSPTATPLVPDNFGRYRANFGLPIYVRATADDSFGLGGNLSTMDLNVTLGGTGIDLIPMTRTAQTFIAGSQSRVANATFEGRFLPRGSFSEAGGTYTFQVVARDAMGNLATASNLADRFVTIDLVDQNGPVVLPQLTGPGGLSGAPLDVEVGVGPINITATITDNSDAVGVPGGAVNSTETRNPFALLRLGSTTRNYTLARVAGTLHQWTFSIPAADINATGNYTVEVSAWDLANNLGRNSTTLQVLVNLPPVITPPTVTDIGAGGSVAVTISDANFDPAATGALVVEVASGTGNFTAVTPTATRSGTVTTVSIPIAADGNSTVRVKATDTLGLSATREFNVRVDAAKPVATVSVVPTEIAAGRAFRPGSESFFVAPATKLQVTASDVGSGVASAAVSIRSSSGATRTLNLTSPTAQFTLQELLGTAGLLDGEYTLTARVADRVGNVETSPEIAIRLDSGAPVFTETLRPATPLSVSVRDQRSGLARVEVEWRTGEGGTPETFELTKGTGDAWTGDFPSEATGSVLFLVRAVDNVGNSAEGRCGTQLCSLGLGNRPPTDLTLTLTSGGQTVAAGGTVRGEVSIGFLGADPEGDQVQFTIKLRRTGAADKVLVADATQSPVPWDTAAEDDGTWTVVLEAKDQGGRSASVTQEVVVRNVGVSLVTPLPTNVNAGGSMLFEYRVTHPSKDVASVVAVLRVGAQTERVPLFDDGTHGDRTANDGTFSAQYTPRLRGQNTVDLQVTYAGETTPATISNVGTFQAQGLAETVASVTFYGVIVLGIIVAALGVFGLRRWG